MANLDIRSFYKEPNMFGYRNFTNKTSIICLDKDIYIIYTGFSVFEYKTHKSHEDCLLKRLRITVLTNIRLTK
jgi:hypothetical protein